MLYIGVDLGTSAVKLLLMDGDGKIQKVVSREYPLFFPHPGWSEQNPEDWYKRSMDGIKELIAEIKGRLQELALADKCMVSWCWMKKTRLFVRLFCGMTDERRKSVITLIIPSERISFPSTLPILPSPDLRHRRSFG